MKLEDLIKCLYATQQITINETMFDDEGRETEWTRPLYKGFAIEYDDEHAGAQVLGVQADGDTMIINCRVSD